VQKVFIDGQAGTTGLQIHDLLKNRTDLEILEISEQERKDKGKKQSLINQADLVILCLPDAAAIESVGLINNPEVKILDASTAHRVNPDWTYGLPELKAEQRELIATAARVSNPGCYPSGFLVAVSPLIAAGILPASTPLTVNAISGYSGGGRQMIEKYVARNAAKHESPWTFRPYAMNLNHKHVPEMQQYSGLEQVPLFSPAVGNFHQGMLVQIPLFRNCLREGTGTEQIMECWLDAFQQEACIKVHETNTTAALEDGMLNPESNNHTNRLDLFLFESHLHCMLVARLDNLGKGAAGAAVQNLNLMLGFDELCGLSV
jgi:N-acetyl-gamma-glutamyl-phosphate reductase